MDASVAIPASFIPNKLAVQNTRRNMMPPRFMGPSPSLASLPPPSPLSSALNTSQLIESLSEYKAENRLLGQLVQDLQSQVRDAHEAHGGSVKRVAALEEEIKHVQTATDAARKHASEAQAALEVCKEELATARSEHCASLEVLQAAKMEAQAVALDLQDVFKDGVRVRERAQEDVRSLRRQLGDAERAATTLQQQLSSSSEGRAELERRVRELERGAWEGQAASAQLAAAERRLLQLEEERGEERARAQRERDQAEARIETMARERDAAEERHRCHWHQTQEQAHRLDEDRQAVEASKREHEQQVCEMRERVTRVEAELQQTREAAKVHAAAEEATRSHQHHLMSKLDSLRKEAVAACQRCTQLLEARSRAEGEGLRLRHQLEAAEEALGALRKETCALRAALHAANQRLRDDACKVAQHLRHAFSNAGAGAGNNAGLSQSTVDVYVQVLQHDLQAEKETAWELRQEVAEAVHLESQARHLLQSARRNETETKQALQVEVRRVLELECLRLSDVRELHTVESRMRSLQTEVGYLIDRLVLAQHQVVSKSMVNSSHMPDLSVPSNPTTASEGPIQHMQDGHHAHMSTPVPFQRACSVPETSQSTRTPSTGDSVSTGALLHALQTPAVGIGREIDLDISRQLSHVS